MATRPSDEFLNSVNRTRLEARKLDELVGLARGLTADGWLDKPEVECLEKWLTTQETEIDQPLLRTLHRRVREILSDGKVDPDEAKEIVATLNGISNDDYKPGDELKSASLPLTKPPPDILFPGKRYCFTGTFNFGLRRLCEEAVTERGAVCAPLTQKIDFLVIGALVSQSWKHSTFGTKIMRAVEWRGRGIPIALVSEERWTEALTP